MDSDSRLGGGDNTAKAWDGEMERELRTLSSYSKGVTSVAWNHDGKGLTSASQDAIVRVYAMDVRDLMALARQRIAPHHSEEGCMKYPHVDRCPPFPQLSFSH